MIFLFVNKLRRLGKSYMRKNIFNWVKNVNKECITISINSVCISPSLYIGSGHNPQTNGKQVVIRVIEHIFTQLFTTTKQPNSPLLFTSYTYYPHRLLLEPKKNI